MGRPATLLCVLPVYISGNGSDTLTLSHNDHALYSHSHDGQVAVEKDGVVGCVLTMDLILTCGNHVMISCSNHL